MAKSRKIVKPAREIKKKSIDSDENYCFVIMPFGGWLDDYYRSVYSPAIQSAGLKPHRADDLFRPSTIVNDIWAYTKKAKVLLADLTGKNPNVFYELGLAHALAKPAILVAETMEDIPFDLRALRVILYDKNAPAWGEILRQKIEASLKEILAAPAEAVLPAFLDVRSAGGKPAVSAEQKEFIEIKQELDLLKRELRVRDIDRPRRTPSRVDLGPDEARKLIRILLDSGVSPSDTSKAVMRMGAPRHWTEREVAEAHEQAGEETDSGEVN